MTVDDPLAESLAEMAATAHAVLYAGYDLGVVDLQLADHSARARFDSALEDDELDALFLGGDAGYVFLSTGEGQQVAREVLPALIIAGAGKRLRSLGEIFSAEDLVEETAVQLRRLRELVRGEEVQYPALSLFGGVGIAPGVEVALPWGVLTHPSEWANTWADWSRSDLMLISQVPIRVAVVEPGENPWPPPDMPKPSELPNERLDRLEHRTTLTLLLALGGKPGAGLLWRTVLGPLFGQGSSTMGGTPRPLFGAQAHIDVAAADAVARWGLIVDERHERKLDIAVDRLISSVTARHDPGDALIDAVIALEAMFAGTDQGELTFRIAAALAALLEPVDANLREAIFHEARDIYAARSKIVHGRGPPSPEAGALRNRAFELGRRALAVLYEDRPELLGDDGRARRLILRLGDPSGGSAAAS